MAKGQCVIQDEQVTWIINAGQWFSVPNGLLLKLSTPSRLVIMQSIGYFGMYAMGGPIEDRGRLRYIDGCSDTLLCAPPLLGNPCLNHLHFPDRIKQTAHTHPSLRAGIIANGQGLCVANQQVLPLATGVIFYLAQNTEHCFITDNVGMDVIAYHPDSDWGPTHEDHPMINRTWVDGNKIDNRVAKHKMASIG